MRRAPSATVMLIDGLNLVRRVHAGASGGQARGRSAAEGVRGDATHEAEWPAGRAPDSQIRPLVPSPSASSQPPAADSKLADAKLADSKLADAKLADAKLADAKLADAKLADPKLADPKLADPGFIASLQASLARAIAETEATHGICALDASGPGWRHALVASYKAKRPPMPDSLVSSMAAVRECFTALGMPCVEVPEMEADDVIASIATSLAPHPDVEVVVLSTDKSLLSLLPLGVRVRNHFDRRELDDAYVRERFGVAPECLLDWLALVGDASVGIPGVPGIGAKSASRLLAEHGSLEALLSAPPEAVGARAHAALAAATQSARLSGALVSLRRDLRTGVNLRRCRLHSSRG